jgi:deazaflavin-dependent oxidoreductase (nitroreductase family)
MGSPAYDRFWGTALVLARSFHHAVDRLSGGRLGAHFPGGAQVVWIQTLGRKSGEWRRTALLGAPDGDSWIIAGSNAGQERVPAWVLNLQADPRGRLEIGTSIRDADFRELAGEERTAAYALLVRDWKGFAMYERNAQRQIPVFRITPTLNS